MTMGRTVGGPQVRADFLADMAGGTGMVGAWRDLGLWSVTSAGAHGPSRPGPVAHRVVLSDGWRFGPVPAVGWEDVYKRQVPYRGEDTAETRIAEKAGKGQGPLDLGLDGQVTRGGVLAAHLAPVPVHRCV